MQWRHQNIGTTWGHLHQRPKHVKAGARRWFKIRAFCIVLQALSSACFCNALIMRYHWQKGRMLANFIWAALLRGVNLKTFVY
jgi:hypothetical protein